MQMHGEGNVGNGGSGNRPLLSKDFMSLLDRERKTIEKCCESVRTMDLDRRGTLRNFPVRLALEFDSRRMGALTMGDFVRFALETDAFYSEREKRENHRK